MYHADKVAVHSATCCKYRYTRIYKECYHKRSAAIDISLEQVGGTTHERCKCACVIIIVLLSCLHKLKAYESHLIIKQALDSNNKLVNRSMDAVQNSYEDMCDMFNRCFE